MGLTALRQKSKVFSTSSTALITRSNSFAEQSSNHAESVMIDHHENDCSLADLTQKMLK
jgi:hypothetical protein